MAPFEQCVQVSLQRLKAQVTLKQQQLDVLRAVYDGKDTIAVLPTGFGKSLLFQMLPFLIAVSFFTHSKMIQQFQLLKLFFYLLIKRSRYVA